MRRVAPVAAVTVADCAAKDLTTQVLQIRHIMRDALWGNFFAKILEFSVTRSMMRTLFWGVSSVVEQLAFNQLVDGSNPSRPTTSSVRAL
tara:strand:+ start:27 stop:296 length:270 start_codon:yes stop_codon:yes gene_type:complete